MDLTQHAGDTQPRRSVTNVNGAFRYDITYRARVSTPVPVVINSSDVDCTLTVDSTHGSSPDLVFGVQVQFEGSGWQTTAHAANPTVSGLEDSDYQMAVGACARAWPAPCPPR